MLVCDNDISMSVVSNCEFGTEDYICPSRDDPTEAPTTGLFLGYHEVPGLLK
jgi:hypothetical protein